MRLLIILLTLFIIATSSQQAFALAVSGAEAKAACSPAPESRYSRFNCPLSYSANRIDFAAIITDNGTIDSISLEIQDINNCENERDKKDRMSKKETVTRKLSCEISVEAKAGLAGGVIEGKLATKIACAIEESVIYEYTSEIVTPANSHKIHTTTYETRSGVVATVESVYTCQASLPWWYVFTVFPGDVCISAENLEGTLNYTRNGTSTATGKGPNGHKVTYVVKGIDCPE